MATTAATAAPPSSTAAQARLKQAGPGVLVYMFVPVLFVVGGLVVDGFTSEPSIRSLLVLASFLGIASIGQTLAVVLGGIDLSIPAVIGMANVMTTQLYGNGMPFALVVLLVLLAALAVGIANGALAHTLRAHTLIITIAMSSIVLGAVLAITEGNTGGAVPTWLTDAVSPIGDTGPLPVPPVVVIWAALAALTLFFQRKVIAGRWIYAMGANADAARLALVPPLAVYAIVFALSAVFAAATGVLFAGFSGAADASVGQPYLFTTIASVVIGGTSLIGGRGGYGRTIAGALLITLLTTILVGLGSSEPVQQMLLGGLIVTMIAIYGRQPRISDEI